MSKKIGRALGSSSTNKIQKGNQLGKANKGKKKIFAPKVTESIRDLIRKTIDWEEKIRILDTMSRVHEVMNGFGNIITAEPDLNAMRILLEYGFGRPSSQDFDNNPQIAALNNLAIALAQNVIPQQVTDETKG